MHAADAGPDGEGVDDVDGLGGLPTAELTDATADTREVYVDTLEKWFDVRARYLQWTDGRLAQMLIATDITARLRAEEQAAALDFVLYMTNTENMVSWHKLTGYYPVRTSAVEALEAEGWFERFPNYSVAFNQLLETNVNPATAGALSGNMQEIRTITEETMQRIFGGGEVDAELARASDPQAQAARFRCQDEQVAVAASGDRFDLAEDVEHRRAV